MCYFILLNFTIFPMTYFSCFSFFCCRFLFSCRYIKEMNPDVAILLLPVRVRPVRQSRPRLGLPPFLFPCIHSYDSLLLVHFVKLDYFDFPDSFVCLVYLHARLPRLFRKKSCICSNDDELNARQALLKNCVLLTLLWCFLFVLYFICQLLFI